MYVRIAYVAVQTIVLGVYFYITLKVGSSEELLLLGN